MLVVSLLTVLSLVLGASFLATRGSSSQEIAAGEPICPDAGTVPGADPTSQELLDDVEALGCVADPTTSTTIETTTTTTTTPSISPPTTLPSAQLVKEENGLRVTVSIQPPELKTAEVLRLSITATDDWDGDLVAGVVWGDPGGSGGIPTPPILECSKDATDSGTSERTWTPRHSYRQAGRYAISVVVAAGYCTRPGRTIRLDGVVLVGAGLVLSNGPLPPIVDAGPSTDGSAGKFNLGIDAGDLDGFVQRIEIDWGDGSDPRLFDYPLKRCKDPVTIFPGPTRRVELEPHEYADPGSYNVKVTVTSVGCGGHDSQTAETRVVAVAA